MIRLKVLEKAVISFLCVCLTLFIGFFINEVNFFIKSSYENIDKMRVMEERVFVLECEFFNGEKNRK